LDPTAVRAHDRRQMEFIPAGHDSVRRLATACGRHDAEESGILAVDSSVAVRQVAGRVAAGGWEVSNLAVTVLCDRPRLGDLVGKMAANLADAFGLEPDQVRVSAKATEGLGFTGRGEGIAATAVCLAVAL